MKDRSDDPSHHERTLLPRATSRSLFYGYIASDMWKGITRRERKPRSQNVSNGFFNIHHTTDRIAHTTGFAVSIVENWLEGEIPQWFHQETHRTMSGISTTELHLAHHKINYNFGPVWLVMYAL